MQHRHLFVFDIETIPDTDAVPGLTGFDAPDIESRRAELERYHLDVTDGRNAFPRQPFHRVVAISFLKAEIERVGNHELYHLEELRTGGEPGFEEEKLLAGFFAYFEQLKPRLVSFNGRSFDLPVLKYRAMVHGVTAPWLWNAGDKWNSYTSRYSADWHCDLLEQLSDYGASARIKMNEVCAVLGLPGKTGIDGSKVTEMFDDGQVAAIRDYCESDVLNTYLVYLHFMRHKGTLLPDDFDRAVADVLSLLKTEAEARPHLGEFLEAWAESAGKRFPG